MRKKELHDKIWKLRGILNEHIPDDNADETEDLFEEICNDIYTNFPEDTIEDGFYAATHASKNMIIFVKDGKLFTMEAVEDGFSLSDFTWIGRKIIHGESK